MRTTLFYIVTRRAGTCLNILHPAGVAVLLRAATAHVVVNQNLYLSKSPYFYVVPVYGDIILCIHNVHVYIHDILFRVNTRAVGPPEAADVCVCVCRDCNLSRLIVKLLLGRKSKHVDRSCFIVIIGFYSAVFRSVSAG